MRSVPSFVLRCLSPIVFPLAMRVGQLLVVHPGHPTHTLAVTTPDGRRVVRYRHMEDGALYGPLLILCDDGALLPLDPSLPQWLRHGRAS